MLFQVRTRLSPLEMPGSLTSVCAIYVLPVANEMGLPQFGHCFLVSAAAAVMGQSDVGARQPMLHGPRPGRVHIHPVGIGHGHAQVSNDQCGAQPVDWAPKRRVQQNDIRTNAQNTNKFFLDTPSSMSPLGELER